MRAFVDSITQGKARLLLGDDESVSVVVPVTWLPDGVREGVVLSLTAAIDQAATNAGIASVQALMDELGDNP